MSDIPVPSKTKLYAERDHYQLSPQYERHLLALTAEGLYSKSAIAAELAVRDSEIERLRAALAGMIEGVRSVEIAADEWHLIGNRLAKAYGAIGGGLMPNEIAALAGSVHETAARCSTYWREHANRCVRPNGHKGECYFLAPSRAISVDGDFPMPSEETSKLPASTADQASAQRAGSAVAGRGSEKAPAPRPVQTEECPGCHTVHDKPLCPAPNGTGSQS